MKMYYRPPKTEMLLVGEKGSQRYELWITEPRRIATFEKIGRHKIMVEGSSATFSTILSAAQFALERTGNSRLFADKSDDSPRLTISGVELVARNVWPQFCEIRRLDPRATSLMEREYQLSLTEQTTLGLQR
jgi:hypothetical protein